MDLSNFKIIIEYDGTGYHGWQRQKHERTLQQEIEQALAEMTRSPVKINGSGRTDAGVHALGQVANFQIETELTPNIFLKGLNSILPPDIVIKDCQRVDAAFHARYDATSKVYQYRIWNHNLPRAIGRQYAWHIRRKLDAAAMQSATTHLTGSHDFKAFEGTGSPRSHTVRQVTTAAFSETDDGCLIFTIEADGFLRFMVRNIVGTLVDVGLDKIRPDAFREILASKDRRNASATAPAHGLFLLEVGY
jgi:tRNA pseudouridine38-40 synthase